jgi:hypothetical protein
MGVGQHTGQPESGRREARLTSKIDCHSQERDRSMLKPASHGRRGGTPQPYLAPFSSAQRNVQTALGQFGPDARWLITPWRTCQP